MHGVVPVHPPAVSYRRSGPACAPSSPSSPPTVQLSRPVHRHAAQFAFFGSICRLSQPLDIGHAYDCFSKAQGETPPISGFHYRGLALAARMHPIPTMHARRDLTPRTDAELCLCLPSESLPDRKTHGTHTTSVRRVFGVLIPRSESQAWVLLASREHAMCNTPAFFCCVTG